MIRGKKQYGGGDWHLAVSLMRIQPQYPESPGFGKRIFAQDGTLQGQRPADMPALGNAQGNASHRSIED
jgi:hypothetical protein